MTETPITQTKTAKVRYSDSDRRNGHADKAVKALKDAGWTYDPETRTWTGTDTYGYRGEVAHYVGRNMISIAE